MGRNFSDFWRSGVKEWFEVCNGFKPLYQVIEKLQNFHISHSESSEESSLVNWH